MPAVLQGMQFADDIPSDSGNPAEVSPKLHEEAPPAGTSPEEEEEIIVPGVVEVSGEPTPTSDPNALEQPNPYIEAEAPKIVKEVDERKQPSKSTSAPEITFPYVKS